MNGKHNKRRVAAAALLLTGVLVLDSLLHLKHTEYHLSCRQLPEAFEGFRIVHLSDLHGMRFGKENEKLCQAVKELQPDLIAITGDMAGQDWQMPAFEELLQGLQGAAPLVYVGGNHEWGMGLMPEVDRMLESVGGENMEGRFHTLEREGESIVIAGAADRNSRADRILPEELTAALREEYPEQFALLLGHRNDWVERYPELPVDLILCGHAHGGIVRLPGVGGLFSVKHGLFASYEKGLYEGEGYTMVVSTGLGNAVPVPRFLNRPEIVSVVLHCEQA